MRPDLPVKRSLWPRCADQRDGGTGEAERPIRRRLTAVSLCGVMVGEVFSVLLKSRTQTATYDNPSTAGRPGMHGLIRTSPCLGMCAKPLFVALHETNKYFTCSAKTIHKRIDPETSKPVDPLECCR